MISIEDKDYNGDWHDWKQAVEAQQTLFGVPDNSVINWSNPGPAVVTNSSVSISGQGRLNTISPAGGIWKSTDDGTNWTPLSDNLPQIGVSGIAIDPTDSNIIYIATGDDDAGDSYSVGVMIPNMEHDRILSFGNNKTFGLQTH